MEFIARNLADFKDLWVKALKSQVIDMLQDGAVSIRVNRPSKSRQQEQKYHAMIADICSTATIKINGVIVDTSNYDAIKALLVVWFEYEKSEMGETLNKPGQTIIDPIKCEKITVRASTKQFTVSESRDFIEFLYKTGIEYGAVFSERVKQYDEYPEMQKQL